MSVRVLHTYLCIPTTWAGFSRVPDTYVAPYETPASNLNFSPFAADDYVEGNGRSVMPCTMQCRAVSGPPNSVFRANMSAPSHPASVVSKQEIIGLVEQEDTERLASFGISVIMPMFDLLADAHSANDSSVVRQLRRVFDNVLHKIGSVAFDPLCAALKDTNPDIIRMEAALALDNVGDSRTFDHLGLDPKNWST